MKLYEIPKEMQLIEDKYLEAIDENGEIIPDKFEEVEKLEEDLKDILINKTASIIKYTQNIESDLDAISSEINRLKTIQSKRNKQLAWLKGYILKIMIELDCKKIETPLGNISTRKSKSVVINENIIPRDERYWKEKIEDSFDKKAIKKLIESGESIAGAMIQENISVNIK